MPEIDPPLGRDRWKVVSPYFDRALDMDADELDRWMALLRDYDPALARDLAHLLDERRAVLEEGFLEGSHLLADESQPLAGQVLGAYRLLSPLGQGGMGTVWLAERADGRFEGRAAVKLLSLSMIGMTRVRAEERFVREGSLLARLAHPNISRLIDAGVSVTGQPYLVLEYVDGMPIDRYCDAHQLGIEARIRLFLEVLAAVAHAHANLVVHRDLKPSNVLVSDAGQVKLLDFGIAKLLEGSDGRVLTHDGASALTPEFAAPEQVTGNQITTATDVYSLGVLLYLLLGGRHPAGGGFTSPADLVKAIVDNEPQKLSDAVANTTPGDAARRATTPEKLSRLLRGDLDTIIAKTLRKNPAERYQSVSALADDLRRYLAHHPIAARPDTLAYRATKFVGRHARSLVIGTGVMVLIGSVVGFYAIRLAAERDRAHAEAAKSAKVSELMMDLLTGADPYRDKPDPTVRAVLDAGAERAQQELATQPDTLAEMLTVIGRVYQRLELLDKAQPILERALALGRGIPGPEHPRVAQTLNDLGVLLRMKGDNAGSVAMLEEALAMRRRLLGERHQDVAVTLSELGRSYGSLGQRDRAESLAREALTMRRALFGEQHRETATSLGDLGLLLWQRGDLTGAEPLLRRSLEISRQTLGDNHPNVSSGLSNLGLVVAERGDYRTAESLFREALEIRRRVLGADHPSLAVPLNNLGYALREEGKYDDAIANLQEAVTLATRSSGANSAPVAHYETNLARIYLAAGNAARAEPLLRTSLASRRMTLGNDDWRTATTESLLGAALTSLARYDEAEGLLLDAKRTLKDVPGAQSREASATIARLRTLYEATGRPEQAAALPTSSERTPRAALVR
jgi:eukaryotic-like serine/threonine-protein kinase